MESSTISLIIILGEQLVDLISWASTKWKAKSRKPLQAELQYFRTHLDGYLQYVKKTMIDLDAIGFAPKSLETLLTELRNFVSLAEDLFTNGCKKEDIRDFRELVMGTFQCQMACALFEVQMKAYVEVKAVTSTMAWKQEMVAKKHGGVHITIFEDQAHKNLGLTKFLSFVRNMPYPAESFREHFSSELAIDHEHPNAVEPTQASKVDKAGMVERSGRLIKEGAEKDEGKEEEEEDKKWEELLLREKMEKQGQRTTKPEDYEEQENPNRNMELSIEKGKGELLVSKHKGSQFELVYEACDASMGMVVGEWPMELSKMLGCFYFEVKLVEMVELSEGRKSGLFGVGVGLARLDKFRTNQMAGKYSKSCGYDGRAGEVYYNNKVQGTSSMGYLANGDTLGIGILQHDVQCLIFFVKNGVLQLCIQDHSLCKSSSSHGLHPVISLASARVRLCVDFCGPFHLSELVMQVKASLPHK